jgi:hypothetical protein
MSIFVDSISLLSDMKMLKGPKMIKMLICIGLSTKAAFCFFFLKRNRADRRVAEGAHSDL